MDHSGMLDVRLLAEISDHQSAQLTSDTIESFDLDGLDMYMKMVSAQNKNTCYELPRNDLNDSLAEARNNLAATKAEATCVRQEFSAARNYVRQLRVDQQLRDRQLQNLFKASERRQKWKEFDIRQDAKLKYARVCQEEGRLRHAARLNQEIESEKDYRRRLGLPVFIPLFFQIEEELFPELDAEAIKLVKLAWNKGAPEDEVFSEDFAVKITRKDLRTLAGLNWLNDEIINFYLNLITYAFNTFFLSTLQQRGYAGVKRWTRKVDVFSYDVLLVPVHLGNHWCLAVSVFAEFSSRRYELKFDQRVMPYYRQRMMVRSKLSAQVLVCGGGLMGLSVAHSLAKRGAAVLLFERDCIGAFSETQPANTGLVTAPSFWPDAMAQRMAKRSLRIYEDLAKVAGFKFTRCGRVYLANSDEALYHIRREMLARWPLIATEDVKLALHSVEDVALDHVGLCTALAESAREMGAKIYENCEVRKVMIGESQGVFAVDTEEGLVDTRIFVNCAGALANMIPISPLSDRHIIPAYPCSYSLLVTEGLHHSGLTDRTPAFVDVDHSTFIYANDIRTIGGGFSESVVRALRLPSGTQPQWTVPQPDWDKFYPILKSLIERVPSMGQLSTGDLVSEVEMYTPDMYPVIGESERVHGYYVANGLNGQGLAMAGGLGDVLAQWILEGASYAFKPLHYSQHQCHTARNLRMSSIYHHLREAGAMFGEIMGYERPLWYEPEAGKDPNRNAIYSGQSSVFGPPSWHSNVAREYEACRERVGLIDMTSFSKFDGPDSVAFLQRICSAGIDRPIGSTIYTGMQNEFGGYVTDCTLSRLSEREFFIVAPSVQQVRCYAWLQKWIKEWNMNVFVQDVTANYTALDLVGPASRMLMSDITGKSMNSSEFPSFSFREIHVGMGAGIRSVSVSHCGELGYILYVPNEIAHYVYEKIIEAGQEYSLVHAGYYALRHLRIEKFFVFWGQDINATVTPVEAGRLFRVDFSKDFIGKAALLEQADQPPTMDLHWEVKNREGDGVDQEFLNSGVFSVDIAGKRFPVRVNLHSPTLPMISSEHPNHYRPTQ
ncbi:hypothetical protein M3Y98_00470800 [Aphelenchoides besseyi]|nr:hypothetical protein M3Y98_00470800 [Aphelenchoides besseyi]